MKSTATMLHDLGQDGYPISPPRRGRKLTLGGAACALGAAAALTVGAVHHNGARSVRAPVPTVNQPSSVVGSMTGLASGLDSTSGDASAAAAADDRTAIEVDSAAANARLHDVRDEREAARAADSNDNAAETTLFAGSSD